MGKFSQPSNIDANQTSDNVTSDASRLEQLLEESQASVAMLQEAQQVAGLGIWKYDILKNKITWSDQVYTIYERDKKASPPSIEDVFYYADANDKKRIEAVIHNAITKGEPYAMDCSILTNKNNIKHVRAHGKPFYNLAGEVSHLFGTLLDITDRIQQEKELKFSHLTIESLSDGIYWIDDEARFIKVNQAVCDAIGYKNEELIGMTGADINPEFSIKKSQEFWKKTKENGGVLVFETYHYHRNGTKFPVEITNNIIEVEGKELRCSIVRNITARKEAEAQIKKALEEVRTLKNQLEIENVYLREEINLTHNFEEIISRSESFKKVLGRVEQVSKSDATVLITGESGTGKELLARAVHNLSQRRDRPLVKINCAVLPGQLIESELFGHEKGAFTGALNRKVGRFELADNGTIFLDEIGELPLALQAKLLRVLQEGEYERLGGTKTLKVNVRVIAATNKDLNNAIVNNEFREDLYYRLNVFPIESPPLRERKEDITLLVKHFVDKYGAKLGKQINVIPSKVLQALEAYNWPGNIRELENLIERAVIISTGNKLDFGEWTPKNKTSVTAGKKPTLATLEKKYIIEILHLTNWRVSGDRGAAKILGLNPKTLDSKMRKLNIKRGM